MCTVQHVVHVFVFVCPSVSAAHILQVFVYSCSISEEDGCMSVVPT